MARVVADSSCLIHLDRIGQLGLLERLFGELAIARAVAREVRKTLPELPEWIHVHTLSRPLPPSIAQRSLGLGESETMALALERSIPWVILDDLEARQFGRSLGLAIVGTGAVLYKAKLKDLIPAARPVLDALLATGFRLSPKVYRTKRSERARRTAFVIVTRDRPHARLTVPAAWVDLGAAGDEDRGPVAELGELEASLATHKDKEYSFTDCLTTTEPDTTIRSRGDS
jgi:predicted nucleic acid-binding protein